MFPPEEQKTKKVKDAAQKISAGKVVALTGAGISVASGIMPFRGQGGLWEKYDPEEMASIEGFRRNPGSAWVMHKEVLEIVEKALPNPAHLTLAVMEERGYLSSIITQNVDGLHQKAGSQNVIEFHGNIVKLICLECSSLYPAAEIELGTLPPLCPACKGVLKPNAVFFGEAIPKEALSRAHAETQQCRVMLVVGTTGIVEPVASLPLLAKSNGAFIIEINPEPSQLTPAVTALFLQGKAEEVLPKIREELNV